MAKGTGLIGNFKGKVGNTVGYKLSASNNGQTQGIRVYQPIVKNPKTAAQAEQRAKLLAVNATYRALKMVIDRGNEGLPYGNKSRLAWLKGALKAQKMPWYEKGAAVTMPVVCPLTKGSIPSLAYRVESGNLNIGLGSMTTDTDITTYGKLSTVLLGGNSFLKEGDQITIVAVTTVGDSLNAYIKSFIIDSKSTVAQNEFVAGKGNLIDEFEDNSLVAAVIVSREGDNGEHLRSTTNLVAAAETLAAAPYDATSKAAAIASYQASAATNSDWAEESIQ